MPLLNGLEFIQLVRASKVRAIRNLPILVVSGHGSKAKVQEAIKVGADDFLVKPISAAALLTHLQRAAARRSGNNSGDHWAV
jgi:CheY-like chemotaxis protein